MIERRGNVLYFDESDRRAEVDAAVRAIQDEHPVPLSENVMAIIPFVTLKPKWTPRHLGVTLRRFQPGRGR